MLMRVDDLNAEIFRLKRKVNALLDGIREHTSKAAERRIMASMWAAIGDGGRAEGNEESGDAGG